MSGEIEKVEQEQAGASDVAQAATQNDEATAAAAAFKSARSGEQTRPEPVQAKPEVKAEPEQATAATVAEKAFLAGMTEKQIAELLGEIPKYRKQIDSIAGNNGKLNAALQQLMLQNAQKGESIPVTIDDEDLADLKAVSPEFADLTKAALNKALAKVRNAGPSTTAPTPEYYIDLAKKAAMEVSASERVNTHVELLHGLNPGWEKVIGVPDANGNIPQTDYRKWLAAQPPAYQAKVNNSNNAFEIGSSIKAFQDAKAESIKKQQQNKSRLANAVQPAGQVAARGVESEQSAADKAFQARRQRT
jgi:hypothetical protein